MTSTFRAAVLRLPAGPVDLTAIDSGATPGFDGNKKAGEAALAALGDDLSDLQERLYAEGSADVGHGRAVLLVLQGMDTSGKGGTLRHTVGLVDPQGVRISSFKKPTEEELEHDFLWRIRKALPTRGIIGVFDRSHYEDVLIVRVHELVPKEEIEQRYDAINAFEAELAGAGITMVKCMLHISADKQKERLLARLDDPTKHWKFNPSDIDERAPLAGVPRGLRDRPRADQHRGRAVVRRAERPQVVPQPGHRQPAARDPAPTSNPQWPAADFDVEEQKRRLAERGPDHVIPTVGVTRYVTPLREGGSLPGIVEADDLGTYVCKFRGAGQGVRVLVAEVIVARAGRADRAAHARGSWRSTSTPPSPATRPTRRSRTCSTPARGSTSAPTSCPARSGSTAMPARRRRSTDPVRVLWLDAFVANVDRSWRNPNLLLWHGNLWVIDHGAALYFHHGWSGRSRRPGSLRAPALERGRPRVPRARGELARRRRRAPRLPGRVGVRRGAGQGARRVARAGPRRRRPGGACARRTSTSSPPASAPPSGCPRQRHDGAAELKLAYEYVVLRCVPRVDREEFLNVGVVLHCQMADFLDVVWHVDRDRLRRPRPADRRRPGLRGPGLRRRASAPATRPLVPRPPSR